MERRRRTMSINERLSSNQRILESIVESNNRIAYHLIEQNQSLNVPSTNTQVRHSHRYEPYEIFLPTFNQRYDMSNNSAFVNNSNNVNTASIPINILEDPLGQHYHSNNDPYTASLNRVLELVMGVNLPLNNTNETGLTDEQINSVLQDQKYEQLPPSVRDFNRTCVITQCDFESNDDVSVLHSCNHVFKKEALARWLRSHRTCPTCRRDVLTL